MKSFFAIKALIVANSLLTVLAAAAGVVGVGVGVFVAVGAGAVVAAGADPPVSAAYEEGMLITSKSVKANFFMFKF